MRVIDADAFMDVIREHEYRLATKQGSIGYGMFTLGIQQAVDEQPTIDAVPVVRCRECKHLNVVNRKELYAHCPKTNTVFLPFELDTREHFCSLGEQKGGAE